MNIEKLRRLFAVTTKDGWELNAIGSQIVACDHQAMPTIVRRPKSGELSKVQNVANMEFITAAHAMMPVMIEVYDMFKEAVHLLETPEDFTREEASLILDSCSHILGEQE